MFKHFRLPFVAYFMVQFGVFSVITFGLFAFAANNATYNQLLALLIGWAAFHWLLYPAQQWWALRPAHTDNERILYEIGARASVATSLASMIVTGLWFVLTKQQLLQVIEIGLYVSIAVFGIPVVIGIGMLIASFDRTVSSAKREMQKELDNS